MFRNYLVTAFRNLTKHGLISFINIGGLTVGFVCAIFIALFIRDELSYDRWIPNTENLYRVEITFDNPGQSPTRTTLAPFPIPQAMLQKIPEVKAMTRLTPQPMTVIAENRQFSEQIDVVDPNFFQLIKLPLLEGSPARVFQQPESAVLSESTARKYFGEESPIGRTLTITGHNCDSEGLNCQTQEHLFVVTGLMRDLPHNTQIKADILIPNTSVADPMTPFEKANWLWVVGYGYIALGSGADPAAVTEKLKAIIDQSVDLKKLSKLEMKGSAVIVPHLTLFRDDHLSTDQFGSMTSPGSWTTVYGFIAIGGLILLVACFNFTNLATARATLRAREISLRKVMGATRGQLVVQFLTESILTTVISLVLALALVEILQPAFDNFLNKPIKLHYLTDWPFVLASAAVAVFAGILSGIYPAFILSSFRPAVTLKSNSAKQAGSGLLRTALVILQFAVSIGLGISAIVVFSQISFARHMDLGFRRNGIVLIDARSLSVSARQSFANALGSNRQILDVAISNSVPFDNSVINVDVHVPGDLTTEAFQVASISPDYVHLYGIRLLAGRVLSEMRGGDTRQPGKPYNVLINEATAKRLGYSVTSALGKTFTVHTTLVTVVGVVANVKSEGSKQQVTDTVYRYEPNFSPVISVRVRDGDLPETLSFINRTWKRFAPTVALERHFLNDDFEKQFQDDEKQGQIFGLFVGIAIFIACLGLFGLSSFAATRRTKEIGVRKVFGARVYDIVTLLLLQFSIPVLIANLIAWPFAWYYLHSWLQGFAYHISLSPAYFAVAGVAALVIAWATVFFHAFRVASASPVHALRYE